MVKKLKLKGRLILVLLLVGLMPFSIMALFSMKTASQALKKQVYDHLISVRDNRKFQIKHYFETIFLELTFFAESKDILDLFDELAKYHISTDSQSKGYFDTSTDEYKQICEKFGKKIIRLNNNNKSFYDVLLICADHGHVMFSCGRENDLGINLKHGPHRNSALAKIWNKVRETKNIAMVDFEPYAPSNNEPASFIGLPVKNVSGSMVGVLAAQLSIDRINHIMQQRSGMGKTGEVYLIGQNKLMRSDSFLDPAHHSVKASFIDPIKGSVDTKSSREALAGKTGEKIIIDYNGNPVLSAFTPLKFGNNITWALIAEIDKEEALQAISKMTQLIISVVLLIFIAVIICTYLVAVTITKPLFQATNELKTSAEELNVAAQQQLSSTTEQSVSTTQINSTINELVFISKQISKTAKEVSISSNKVLNTTQNSTISLDEAVEGIDIIRQQVEKVVKNMISLGEKSQQMNLALDIIKELSEQTTILSYNTTIEAAGAGEAGRRFSAIADQIMKLAGKSTDFSKEIKIMIEDMQKSANKTVLATEDGMKAALEGKRRIEISRNNFDNILSLSQTNVSQSKEIEITIAQQYTAIEESAQGIENITISSEEIKTSSNQTQVTADQLVEMANKLADI